MIGHTQYPGMTINQPYCWPSYHNFVHPQVAMGCESWALARPGRQCCRAPARPGHQRGRGASVPGSAGGAGLIPGGLPLLLNLSMVTFFPIATSLSFKKSLKPSKGSLAQNSGLSCQ